ncbi:MAG: NTP transferase domain-containing protein, partial [Sphingomonas sp.]
AAGGRAAVIVRARRYRAGLSESLRAGLAALRPGEREIYVFLGDMPAVPPLLARRLARAMKPDVAAVRPVHRGQPGHPVLLRRPSPAAIAALSGDRGLSPPRHLVRIVPAGRGALVDIDKPGHKIRVKR